MGVESLRTLSTVFYTLAGVLFVTAIVLFFVLGIPKAFGIFTGLSVARGIKKYQDKIQKENAVNQIGKVGVTSPVSMQPMRQPESPQTSKITTTNLMPKEKPTTSKTADTTLLNVNPEDALPIENPDAVFTVIQELSFTSSAKIIE